jgi:hypothetical protein
MEYNVGFHFQLKDGVLLIPYSHHIRVARIDNRVYFINKQVGISHEEVNDEEIWKMYCYSLKKQRKKIMKILVEELIKRNYFV